MSLLRRAVTPAVSRNRQSVRCYSIAVAGSEISHEQIVCSVGRVASVAKRASCRSHAVNAGIGNVFGPARHFFFGERVH